MISLVKYIAYSKSEDLKERHKADRILEEAASQRLNASDASIGEKMAAFGVKGAMKIKRKLGMGLKNKKRKRRRAKKGGAVIYNQRNNNNKRGRRATRKERILPIPKRGGFLPLLLPLLGALGAVGGGAASIAKAVNDAKANRQQLEEQKRHDLEMEKSAVRGKGLYLRPYKGYGIKSKN